MARELVQARADPDTVDAIEEYAEERDISRSEAIRRLLRAGVEAQNDEEETLFELGGYSVARVAPIIRLIGGALMGIAVLYLLLAEFGLL